MAGFAFLHCLEAQEQPRFTTFIKALDAEQFGFGPELVFDPQTKSLRLAQSVFLTDELGASDYRQGEPLQGQVLAKKLFALELAGGKDLEAELIFFGTATEIQVNGKKLPGIEKVKSTGWSRAKIPGEFLTNGDNEFILKNGRLLVDVSQRPGRSFKSTDGGATWSNRNLTSKGNQDGEYLIRLRLKRYASKGQALTGVLDLWAEKSPDLAHPPHHGHVMLEPEDQPEGTRLKAHLRTGTTPTPDAKTWTDWVPLGKEKRVNVPAPNRWAQVKFTLETDHPEKTSPALSSINLYWSFIPTLAPDASLTLKQGSKALERPGLPFVYQEPSPRLKLLRERYKLDEVIAPGKTEFEQLQLLRHWVRNQWHTAWKGHPAEWMPPWDTLIILESKDQPDCLTMCTHYGCVFTQCCLALGWNARHCILDHHCVSEVFVNQFEKWVMMDAGNSKPRPDCNLHFEKSGLPLSARELHLAYTSGTVDGITVHFTPARLMDKIAHLCRPAPDKLPERPDVVPLAELKKFPVCQIENYRRYGFPGRNNYLSSLFPGELYQGWSSYYYDGYWWVGDSPDDPKISPEYSLHLDPNRREDVDWKLNQTRVHLARTMKPGLLQVDLETNTPNFLRYERKAGDSWKPASSSFTWPLDAGDNELVVRSVNRWEKAEIEEKVAVSWKK